MKSALNRRESVGFSVVFEGTSNKYFVVSGGRRKELPVNPVIGQFSAKGGFSVYDGIRIVVSKSQGKRLRTA